MYGEGISRLGELVDLGARLDLVQKSGSWYNRANVRLGRGEGRCEGLSETESDVADRWKTIRRTRLS
jgi:recombination protein RecA